MRQVFSGFLALWFVLPTGWLLTQKIVPDQKTLVYLNSEPHKRLIAEIVLTHDQALHPLKGICREPNHKWEPLGITVLRPLSFPPGSEHPDSGAWSYRLKFHRCGEAVIYNGFLSAREGEPPRSGVLIPGLTRTDPGTWTNMFVGIGFAARRKDLAPECIGKVEVVDTKITAEESRHEGDRKRTEEAWEEQWVCRACGEDFTVDFCLTRFSNGQTLWRVGKCAP